MSLLLGIRQNTITIVTFSTGTRNNMSAWVHNHSRYFPGLVQQVITIKLIFCFDFFVLFRYVISELCVGTLHDIVCGGYPMLNDNRMAMLQQITLALEHLHTNGIIHRDLKPSNILVLISSGTGLAVWKLADFGIFRIVQVERSKHTLVKGRSKLFRASGIKGWIAPEMLLSNMSFSCWHLRRSLELHWHLVWLEIIHLALIAWIA